MKFISLLFPAVFFSSSDVFFPPPVVALDRDPPSTCSYEMQVWNVHKKTSDIRKKVQHPYRDLSKTEIDALTGCTVCTEDQEQISIPPLPSFLVCAKLAPQIQFALEQLIVSGQTISTISAYRVIKSRGTVDESGNRTEFSNHSFGAAIDINPEKNGLYDNCVQFGPKCRLLRGGEWRQGTPGTIEENGEIVKTFRKAGFRWGGGIAGKQKDFMHFSLTGY